MQMWVGFVVCMESHLGNSEPCPTPVHSEYKLPTSRVSVGQVAYANVIRDFDVRLHCSSRITLEKASRSSVE